MYLVTYAGRGLYAPFISLYLLSIGYSAVEIGLLTAISAFARLIIVPAYSAWIDRRGAHRKLLSVQLFLTGASTLSMAAWANTLWAGGMFLTRDMVDIPGATLQGQLSITKFREHGSRVYSKLRAMGSLGWALSSFISGWLISLGGYTLLIILSGLAYLLSVPMVQSFPERTAATNSRIDKPPKRMPAFWLIMASDLLYYVGTNAMSVFIFVYFKEYLGADDTGVGVYAAFLGLFEVPWMLVMGRVYKRLSTRTALMLGLLGQAMFMLVLALLVDQSLLLPLIAFRGFFYALQNISLTLIVTEISHPANVATNQALAWVTMPALAALVTGPIIGWMYEHTGPRLMYALAALVILVSALLLTIGRRMIDRARAARLPLHVN